MPISRTTPMITRMIFLCIFGIISFEGLSQLQLEWETKTLTNLGISNHIVRLDDQQNIFIAGTDDSDSTDVDVFKFSNTGELIWHYHYDGDSMLYDGLGDLLIDRGGDVLITGYSYDRNLLDYDVVLDYAYRSYIIKLDAEGDLDWIQKYGTSDTSRSEGLFIKSYDDSTYFSLIRNEHGNYWGIIMLIHDQDGKLLKDSLIYQNPHHQEILLGIYSTPDQKIYMPILRIEGYQEYLLIKSFQSDGTAIDSFVMAPPHYFNFYAKIEDPEYYGALNIGQFGVSKLNKNGRHLWDYSIPKNGPENTFSDIVNAITTDESGVYLVGRHFRENSNSDLLAHKLSHTGNLLWEYRYDNRGKYTYEAGQDLIRINNQLVIAGQQQQDSAGRSDLLVIVLDADQGRVIQIDTTDYGINSYAFKLEKLDDKDFYLFGIANTSLGRELILRKYGLSTSLEATQINFPLSIFPNPASDFITIESDRAIDRISIYSVTGQKINVVNALGTLKLDLSLAAYDPGIYYLKVHGFTRESIHKIIRLP